MKCVIREDCTTGVGASESSWAQVHALASTRVLFFPIVIFLA
jgi:hypothetical protein